MDRRGFFKNMFSRTVNVGVDLVDQRAKSKAKHWFRPPFAVDELDFLLACTRCNDCADACPHQLIFPLPLGRGPDVAGTPAMDLLNKGCHLCEDWPCITACKTDALSLVALAKNEEQTEEPPPMPTALECPPLGKAHINETVCIAYSGPECGACRGSCPIPDTLLWRGEKPYIDAERCIGCSLCREVCITGPKAIEITPYEAI